MSFLRFKALNKTLPYYFGTSVYPTTAIKSVEDIGESFKGQLALAAPSRARCTLDFLHWSDRDMPEPGHVGSGEETEERGPSVAQC